MQRIFLTLFLIAPLTVGLAQTQLQRDLARSYIIWQRAMQAQDVRAWSAIVAPERQVEVKNTILSEKGAYPSDVFKVPVQPPAVKQLRMLNAESDGTNAKAVFFGKVDFNVGGAPENNLLVVSYQSIGGHWRFVKAEYVNLASLPDVRKQIEGGDYSYLSHADFKPSAYNRPSQVELTSPAPIIAKVFAYCPGREIRAVVNNRSTHLFQNTQDAAVVIGGAGAGKNTIKFQTKKLPGGLGSEPLRVCVFLLSKVNGVKPIKAYEYLVKEGAYAAAVQTASFEVTPAMIAKLQGK